MKIRIFYVILTFGFLFCLFYFLEEKVEDQTEINFWKENWKVVSYFPPKETWCGTKEPEFGKIPLQMQIYERGWKKPPIFSVSFQEEKNKNIILYEGNFNIKNTFSDLSALKTKFIESSNESIEKAYCLGEDAPSLLVSIDKLDRKNPQIGKRLYFGKKMDGETSRISARVEDKILSPYGYLLEKFRGKSVSLRERQYVTYTGGFLKSVQFTGQGLQIRMENAAKKNQYESFVNHWNRPTGERIVLAPEIGNALETQVKNLRADLYPDDEMGSGFTTSNQMVAGVAEVILDLEHSDGNTWKVSFFPKVEIANQRYRPVIRELKPYFVESPSFVKEETFQSFIQAALAVKNASRWERPNQKIQ